MGAEERRIPLLFGDALRWTISGMAAQGEEVEERSLRLKRRAGGAQGCVEGEARAFSLSLFAREPGSRGKCLWLWLVTPTTRGIWL